MSWCGSCLNVHAEGDHIEPDLDCVQCLLRGHRCRAKTTNLDGQPVCLWCADCEPCPQDKKNVRTPAPIQRPINPIPEEKQMTTPAVKKNGAGADSIQAVAKEEPRLCAAPGCVVPLTHLNKSGFCTKHFGRSRRKNGGNGADNKSVVIAAAAPSQNSANGRRLLSHSFEIKSAGEGHERVDAVLLRLPLETKIRLATDWLRGAF